MRLLYIIPEYPPHFAGGIGTFYASLLPAIAARGHQIRAVVGSALSHQFGSYKSGGVEVECLSSARILRFEEQFASFTMFPLLRRHLAASWAAWEQAEGGATFDAVETTDWGLLFIPWMVNRTIAAKVQLHGSSGQVPDQELPSPQSMEINLSRFIEINCLRGAKQLQTYSQSNQRAWNILLRRPILHAYPPLKMLSSDAIKGSTPATGVVVGRIQNWKGPALLCQAMRLLGHRAPRIKWIGRDMTGNSGTSLSRELGEEFPDVWGTTILPVGQRSPEETSALIREAHFGVVPSTWDVFNLAAAEMMAAGIIVLCSDGAGAAELIRNLQNGIIFESRNAESLAAGIRRILELSEAERTQIGGAGQETVATKLNPSAVADKHIASFQDILNNREGEEGTVDAWTAKAVSPQPSSCAELAFLDQLPLRKLAAYVGKRTAKKLSLRR